jgi:hypothetical protein
MGCMTCHSSPDLKKKLQATLLRFQLLKVVGKSRRECFTPEKINFNPILPKQQLINSKKKILFKASNNNKKKKLEKLK